MKILSVVFAIAFFATAPQLLARHGRHDQRQVEQREWSRWVVQCRLAPAIDICRPYYGQPNDEPRARRRR